MEIRIRIAFSRDATTGTIWNSISPLFTLCFLIIVGVLLSGLSSPRADLPRGRLWATSRRVCGWQQAAGRSGGNPQSPLQQREKLLSCPNDSIVTTMQHPVYWTTGKTQFLTRVYWARLPSGGRGGLPLPLKTFCHAITDNCDRTKERLIDFGDH